MNRTALIAGGAAVVSAAAGVAAGYFVAVKRMKGSFEEELKAQIEAAEKVFKMKYKVGMYDSPIEMLKERHVPVGQITTEQVDAARVAYGQVSDLDEKDLEKILAGLRREDTPEPVHLISGGPGAILGMDANKDVNVKDFVVFDSGDGAEQPNYERWIEEHPRGPEAPYVITNHEFHAGDRGYETASLTWFDENETAGMGVLIDGRDDIVDDVDAVVGEVNMTKFGMWSGQHSIVYIRNEYLEVDFEVIRMRGSYAENVGLKQSSRAQRFPKQRRGNDDG